MAIERKISKVKDTHRHHHLSISLSTARNVSSCQSSSTFTSYSSLTAVVLLLMAAQLVTQVEGVWNHSCTVEQMASERNGFVCGANIPKTLQLVCGKRGTADRGQQPPCRGRRDLRLQSDEDNAIFLSKKRAMSVLRGGDIMTERSQRAAGAYQQGIVCECCVHQCALRELRQYCNPCARRSSMGGSSSHSLTSSSAERTRSGEGSDVSQFVDYV